MFSLSKHVNTSTYWKLRRKEVQDGIYKYGCSLDTNNVITRHTQPTCHALDVFDKITPLNTVKYVIPNKGKIECYGCSNLRHKTHPVYLYSCFACGEKFQKMRHLTRDLRGYVALITGARTKLGHQICLKLLRAGATVIITTRLPSKAFQLFQLYEDYLQWNVNLYVYPEPLDFNCSNLCDLFTRVKEFIAQNFGKLDILINCAAQTIKVREEHNTKRMRCEEKNRYGDDKYVHHTLKNSWNMQLCDLTQEEMEEVYRINSVAPCLLIQHMIEVMRKSDKKPYIINVHAREGLLEVDKSDKHIHTNMAKCALAMLTKCIIKSKMKTDAGVKFSIHGCDPGWISVDEYYEKDRPWIVPPLDEIDGASRILYPLFKGLNSCKRTRRHFHILKY